MSCTADLCTSHGLLQVDMKFSTPPYAFCTISVEIDKAIRRREHASKPEEQCMVTYHEPRSYVIASNEIEITLLVINTTLHSIKLSNLGY